MKEILTGYLYEKPLFLALLRSIEGNLYQKHLKLIDDSLDFGCGDGFFARQFFPQKITIGVDINPRVLLQAQKSAAYHKVILYDGHRLPLPRNHFRTIVSNCVLEHIPNLEQNVREIHRVLRPKGKFYATVMESRWNDYLLGKTIFGAQYIHWMQQRQSHHHLLSRSQWENLFQSVGFRVIKSHIYLNRRLCRMIDIFHYLGIGNLISHHLTGKWILAPQLRRLFPLTPITSWGQKDIAHPGGALFIVAEKT